MSMVLSVNLRGVLEQIVDDNVRKVPALIEMWRNEAVRQQYQITNPADFVYGYLLASMHDQFVLVVQGVERRLPSDQEILESKDIVIRRIIEIRNAIFSKG